MNLITVTSAGQTNVVETTQKTIGGLFGDSQFREDHCIPERAVPTVNGSVVDSGTPITSNMEVSFQIAASSKSKPTG